jgi:hypothetical protein
MSALESDENEITQPPSSFMFGDGIAWDAELEVVHVHVELPFWMMAPSGRISLAASREAVVLNGGWEVHVDQFRDSRRRCVYQGPLPDSVKNRLPGLKDTPLVSRSQRTILRFEARCHVGVTDGLTADLPRRQNESETYLASLCEAHIPFVNEVIQRYRLSTYDYLALEVSAWQVPVWFVHFRSGMVPVRLFNAADWDQKPRVAPGPFGSELPPMTQWPELEFATCEELSATSAADATPAELELLDGRALMERGDYTGAIRRTTTALEVVVGIALETELARHFDAATVAEKLKASQNDFPGRLRQWQKLAGVKLSDPDLNAIERIRDLRHEIVHKGRRLTYEERGLAQMCVDTSRWVFNRIEGNPTRAQLRETKDVLRSIGRPSLALRFPVSEVEGHLVVGPLRGPASKPAP